MKIISRKEAIANGLPRYFTGKPCKNGHISERVTNKCDCVECNNMRNYQYRSIPENKEKARLRTSEWRDDKGIENVYASNEEWKIKTYGSTAEYWKVYNSKNSDARSSQSKDYYSRNKDVISAKGKEYRDKNPDAIKERKLKHYTENKDLYYAANRRRRAREKDAYGTHTAKDVALILIAQDYKCVYCGVALTDGYHVDHIMPLALKGSNWPSNLQCLCPTCNLCKSDKHPDDWHKEIGHASP